MKRPALVSRFPKPIWWRPDPAAPWPEDWPVVPADAGTRFPELAADLRIWHDECEGSWRHLDHQAQILQHRFWRQQLALILGGLLITTLGTIQAAAGGGVAVVAGLQAATAGLLVGLTAYIRGRQTQQGYLTARLQAERIKSEFFLLLGRVGPYAEADREALFRRQLGAITDAEEIV